MTPSPLTGMLAVLAMLGALTGALRLWQARRSPHPELVRKCLHVGMGLVTLTFPLFFAAAWPVVTLAALAVGAMFALRHVRQLRERLGSVLHAVERESSGEIYFPLAVAIVFVLAEGAPVHYVVPILLLTLADATAALIGVRYGTVKFANFDGGIKSLEGAIAFFLVAFLCTHVTLLLATDTGRAESLLIGVEIGVLVMLVELVAWRGLDNLFIPLFSFALLCGIEHMPAAELASRLVVLALLAGFVVGWRRRTTLDASALVATVLIAHVLWSVGGLVWLLPPVLCFASYALLWPLDRRHHGRIHDLRGVLSFSAVGLAWLLLSTRFPAEDWSFLGTTAFAGQLAVVGRAASDRGEVTRVRAATLARCALVGWVVPFLPYVLLHGADARTLQLAATALPAVVVTLLVFHLRWPRLRAAPYSMERWVTQAAASATASLLALPAWRLLSP
ncbi:MAG: diacylglycerol/polyprenol kinase family protein [Gammaproteobacteria bacterium]